MLEDVTKFIKENKVLVISLLVFFILYCNKKQKKQNKNNLEKFTSVKTLVDFLECSEVENKDKKGCELYCTKDADCSNKFLNKGGFFTNDSGDDTVTVNKCNTNRKVNCNIKGINSSGKVNDLLANQCRECITDKDCNIGLGTDDYSKEYSYKCVSGLCKQKDYKECSDETHCHDNFYCKTILPTACSGKCYPNKDEMKDRIETMLKVYEPVYNNLENFNKLFALVKLINELHKIIDNDIKTLNEEKLLKKYNYFLNNIPDFDVDENEDNYETYIKLILYINTLIATLKLNVDIFENNNCSGEDTCFTEKEKLLEYLEYSDIKNNLDKNKDEITNIEKIVKLLSKLRTINKGYLTKINNSQVESDIEEIWEKYVKVSEEDNVKSSDCVDKNEYCNQINYLEKMINNFKQNNE
jgi:hypothetical protein